MKKYTEGIGKLHESSKTVNDELIDELMDSIYMNGTKEGDNYILTQSQMKQVGKEIILWIDKNKHKL